MRRLVRAIWLTRARLSSVSLFSPVRSAQRVARQLAVLIEARPGPVAASAYTAVQGAVDPLHDVERVITDRRLGAWARVAAV